MVTSVICTFFLLQLGGRLQEMAPRVPRMSEAYLWRGNRQMAQKKKVVSEESPFLKSAAEAIGTTIGKLALRTGVVKPPTKTVAKSKKAAPKTRTVAAKRKAVARPAKKAAQKTSR